MFDVEKYPEAVYKGNLTDFIDGAPTKVKGSLTLHGVTKPVDLDIKSFKCRLHHSNSSKFVAQSIWKHHERRFWS
ncbi:MAG: hypothetical protein CM15mP51_21000 [Porticoccaceae bacterium]|nr:MAG: hypothetical protein CM15mP51_21000 [Porticoccaceae bacterium]